MYMQTWYANLHIGIYTYYTCIFKITRVLLTAHIDFSTYRTPGSPFDICIPGSSWSWKFRHQSQKLSILPNSREKELMNGYFHSRTLFFASERFRAVLKAFFTLFLRFWNAILPLQNVQSVPNGKNHSGVLFSTPIPTIVFFGGLEELKIPVFSIGKLQVL